MSLTTAQKTLLINRLTLLTEHMEANRAYDLGNVGELRRATVELWIQGIKNGQENRYYWDTAMRKANLAWLQVKP